MPLAAEVVNTSAAKAQSSAMYSARLKPCPSEGAFRKVVPKAPSESTFRKHCESTFAHSESPVGKQSQLRFGRQLLLHNFLDGGDHFFERHATGIQDDGVFRCYERRHGAGGVAPVPIV